MAIISALVAHNTCLLDLSLTGNWRIGAEGGALMAECLESNHTLHTLDMYGCKLGDEGVRKQALEVLWRALAGRHTQANVPASAVNPPPLPDELASAVPGAMQDSASALDVGAVVGVHGVVVGVDGALSDGDEAYNPAFREVERVIARRPGHDGTSPEWLVKWRGLP